MTYTELLHCIFFSLNLVLISPTGADLMLLQIYHDIVILGHLIVFLSAAKVQCTEYIGYIVAAPVNG